MPKTVFDKGKVVQLATTKAVCPMEFETKELLGVLLFITCLALNVLNYLDSKLRAKIITTDYFKTNM